MAGMRGVANTDDAGSRSIKTTVGTWLSDCDSFGRFVCKVEQEQEQEQDVFQLST